MNIDFLANINKTSGTQNTSSDGASVSAVPGFREQIDRAMRDNDRKNEPAAEKKPIEKKKPYAAALEERNSVKTAKKAEAPKKNDRTVQKNAGKEIAATDPSNNAEKASETDRPKFVLADEEDSGLNDGLENANVSETENVYLFAPVPVPVNDDASEAEETEDADVSETENVYLFAPVPDDASETEDAFTYIPPAAETGAPDELADSSVYSSTDAMLFPLSLIQNDSGFEAITNADVDVENTDTDAGVNTGTNAAQSGNTGALPPPAAEVISNMVLAGGTVAATQPGTANVNTEQNASFSGNAAANAGNEFMTATDAVKLPDEESAQTGAKEVLEEGFLRKNQASEQNPVSNVAAAPLRGESARAETESESKPTEDAELDLSMQQAARASSENSETDDFLMERLATQALRPREVAAFANVSENAGKTVQVAGTTVHVASGAEKADASVQTRSVNTPDMDFIVELAGRIQAQIRGGREMIRIQLHPEELGRLEIHAESGRNGIIARIAAESLDVKKLLENNIQNLQQTLEARGLKIDRLHIIVEDNAYAAFADAGRYGYNGTGARDTEISEFSGAGGAKMEPLQEDDSDDLSAEAERRGAGFYTVG